MKHLVTFLVVSILIVYFIINPMLSKKINEYFTDVDVYTDDVIKLDKNMCSKSCCKFTQWPVPSDMVEQTNTDTSKFIGSNMTCSGNTSGCLCVSNNDFNYLASRGNN